MNVRLHQGAVGQNFNFVPKQIVSCSDDVGRRLIAGRVATKASDAAEADDAWPELTAEEKAEAQAAARAKYKRMGLDPDKIFAKRRGIERAIKPAAKTPEGDGEGSGSAGDSEKCAGKTGAGNPCGRAPKTGSEYCAAHEPK